MLTLLPCSYFRWLTRRHLHVSHVSAKKAATSKKLVEPLSDSLEQPTRTGDLDVPLPKKGVRRRKATGPSLLVESKVKNFLDHVESIKDTLSLADLERYKPDSQPKPSSPEFEVQYNALCDTLCRAFNKQQLRVFLELYGLDLVISRPKKAHAIVIMEDAWSWPSLEKIKKERIDWTQTSQRNLPMDPGRSFLLMGKDGADLVNISKNYNVHVALQANPLALRVEGLNGALDQFETYLKQFYSDIELVVTSLPSNRTIPPETAKSISRLSGAYLEFKDNAKLHITFRRSIAKTAVIAERLAVEAAFGKLNDSTQAIYLPLPSAPIREPLSSQSYSLYPFFSPQRLPWKIQSRNAFRLRRVGKWLNSDSQPVLQNTSVLAGGGTALSDEGNDLDMRAYLLDKLKRSSGNHSSRTFTASTGHLLILSSLDEPATLVPPLRGPQDVSTVLKWTKDHPNRVVFHPSLPKPLMESLPYKQQVFHRFVYVAHKDSCSTDGGRSAELSTALTLEIASVSENSVENSAENSIENLAENSGEDSAENSGEDSAENSGEDSAENSVENSAENSVENLAENSAAALSTPKASCRLSIEASMDLLIPSCITDFRFSATDSESLPHSQWPEELQSLAHQMEAGDASPDIPLSFKYRDTDYALHSNSEVRQIYKTMAEHDPQASILPAAADFVIESILDPSTKENRVLCKAICSDHTSDVEWQTFLSKCDWLVQLFEGGEKANGPDMFTLEMEGRFQGQRESVF